MDKLPDSILRRISSHLPPVDRIRLQTTCRRFKTCFALWSDVAVDIRAEPYGYADHVASSKCAFQFPMGKVAKTSFHVKLTDIHGNVYRIRTIQDKSANKALKQLISRLDGLQELTLWDSCLTSDFLSSFSKLESIQILRLWNCSKYFESKNSGVKLVKGLLALPNLHSILVLDSTSAGSSAASCRATFSKTLALKIRGPIENLQLTGLNLPLKTIQVLATKLTHLKRLSIGCTFGQEKKRIPILKTLQQMRMISDLDLPPFLFHLSENACPDAVVQQLFDVLPLRALGFRHYNSSVLFKFIEQHLPLKIRVLRIHHNANRIPNFAQLGTETELDKPEKKSSVSSKYSILSTSRSSIGSNDNGQTRKDSIGAATSKAFESRKDSTISSLAMRRLTIFAVEESKRRTQRLKRRVYSNVDVIYTQSQASQEVLGRMAEPMRSPTVYSKSAKREMRVIKGDLVRPIPLSLLGFESEEEAELSDYVYL
uniref:F-box domain-containing protein n=1 Tax=Panagrolaimus sp. JU765 TaxID=591449 RepID=A0AC34QNP2_9BILA